MKKIILSAFIVACLTACNNDTKNKIEIPEAQYMLDGKRGFIASLECGMTEVTFGKTLKIIDGKINTDLADGTTAQYDIKKLEGNNYLTTFYRPVMQDTGKIMFSYDADTKELTFLCESTKIVYQKED